MTNSATLKEIDVAALKRLMDQDRAVLFDIREQDEYAREHIPGAIALPMTKFDTEVLLGASLGALPGDREKVGVFHCNSGNRTQLSANFILSSGFAEIYHLGGGITAWKKAKLPTVVNRKAPISLMRQVQIVAGSLVVLGVLLGLAFSPWFIVLSAFVGAGLAFAGLTGTCAMASILGRLPFNRPSLANNPAS